MITSFEEWIAEVPVNIKEDALWEMETYRKALFVSDLVWYDCELLIQHPLGKPIAEQLIRSAGSIQANMEEGFGSDYARFLRIALDSARESRGWYYRGRRLLKLEVLDHRLDILNNIIAGLVIMSKQQAARGKSK